MTNLNAVSIGQNNLHWVAGLVEGEGCFYYRVRKVKGKITEFRFKHTALITVGMTDRDVIQRLAYYWKTSVRLQSSHVGNKSYYVTVIHGKQAIGWMLTLYSLMGKRRKAKIKEIILQWRG